MCPLHMIPGIDQFTIYLCTDLKFDLEDISGNSLREAKSQDPSEVKQQEIN